VCLKGDELDGVVRASRSAVSFPGIPAWVEAPIRRLVCSSGSA